MFRVETKRPLFLCANIYEHKDRNELYFVSVIAFEPTISLLWGFQVGNYVTSGRITVTVVAVRNVTICCYVCLITKNWQMFQFKHLKYK